MENLKKRWEIQHNWQLLFPILGVVLLAYSAYKLSGIFFDRHFTNNIPYLIGLSVIFYFILLKFFLFCFKKLENKWIVAYKWEMIRIFIVFAITGTSSVFIGKPIIKILGITKENLNIFVYWFLYIIIGLIFYQILLITIGWLFGQFQFFWEFEKKMLKRFGLKRFFKD
ncbi:DUF6787 family protein [Pontimicrobium aquaticum]|uniref:DUF6787 domain-containing protein n=1 Tax=Pontimicrobium aquaticum TaxID=2565367 RepID=A0A4U0EQH4_9FLAO|nr:DUF6787 family protein [Pontimicrobium aquaticum]TJY33936.1 hypothetical protein E5167_11470 [Pontimicrobium aquaticum]